MSIDDCVAAEERLSALLDGELPPAEGAAARAHARACARCGAVLRDLEAVSRTLRAWDRAVAPVAVSHGFRTRLRARLAAGEEPAARRRAAAAAVAPPAPRGLRRIAGIELHLGAAAAAAAVAVIALAAAFRGAGEPIPGAADVAVAPPAVSPAGDVLPRDPDLLLERARAARERGDAAAARRAALHALAAAPDDARVAAEAGALLGFDVAVLERGRDTGGRPSPPPTGGAAATTPGEYRVGTHRFDSLDAYEAFLAARDEMRRFDLAEAARRASEPGRPEVVTVATDRRPDPERSPLASAFAALEPAGAPVVVDGIAIHPLRRRGDAPAAPPAVAASLEELLREQRVEVKEDPARRDGRSVLVSATRREGGDLLLLAGEILVGGRADRMVARDAVIPAGAVDVPVPVVPVEVGRRGAARPPQSRFDAVAGVAGPNLRGLAVAQPSPEEVTDAVRRTLDALRIVGLHRSLADAYADRLAGPVLRHARRRAQALAAALAPADVTAFAVARGGEFVGVEVFGSHELLADHGERLLLGYAIEASGPARGDGSVRGGALAALLASAADGRPFASGGVVAGAEVGLVAANGALLASGVLSGGRVVHASLVGGAGPASIARRDGREPTGGPIATPGSTVSGPGDGGPAPGGGEDDGATVSGGDPPAPAGGPTER